MKFAAALVVVFLSLFSAQVLAGQGSIPASLVNFDVPGLVQTDPAGDLPGGGEMYCAPVSAAKSMIWLAGQGYSGLIEGVSDVHERPLEVARVLGRYMETCVRYGTSTEDFIGGMERYIADRDYEIEDLGYMGWRECPAEYRLGRLVDLDWVKAGVDGPSAVWINVGWYKYNARTRRYERDGGHWMTVVGYGIDSQGNLDSNVLAISDPASGQGLQYAELDQMDSGELERGWRKRTNAKGFWRVNGGMYTSNKAGRATIVDGVIVMKLAEETG